MKKIIKFIQEKIKENVLIKAIMVLGIVMILNWIVQLFK